MKSILSNMGFVMQFAGIFLIFPIIVSFIFQETDATISLFIAAFLFLGFGFLLNALCERKSLSFKESSILIVLVFVFLSVIGAIPYFYINFTNTYFFERLVDSIFESASGFTTTGFTIVNDVTKMPQSILFYRALTQFIGGIGIVLVLLAFFYPEEKLKNFAKTMGINENVKIKRTLIWIIVIYLGYSLILVVLGFILGYRDILMLISTVLSALSTGGFTNVNDITPLMQNTTLGYLVIMAMILGACNFIALAGLVKFKIKDFFKSEIPVFFLLIILATSSIIIFLQLNAYDSLFHTISAMTNAGFGYLDFSSLSSPAKLLFSALMFIGGTSLSTAGGIKIYRLIVLFASIRKSIHESLTNESKTITVFGREYNNRDIVQLLIVIILMAGLVLVSSWILVLNGYSLEDSLFETSSAISNTGLSVGIVVPTLAIHLKILFIAVMLLGRVEVFSFLMLLSRTKEKN